MTDKWIYPETKSLPKKTLLLSSSSAILEKISMLQGHSFNKQV